MILAHAEAEQSIRIAVEKISRIIILRDSSESLLLCRKRGCMMPMIEFISENWKMLSVLFSILSYMYYQILAMRKGIRALLRADLIRLYNKYHDDLGYCICKTVIGRRV